jgi:hypothetical protein
MKLIRKNIRSLFSELLEENIEIWKDHVFNSITVPLSTVKHNLYKHTIKVTKGKKRSIPKKPRKPSKRIEILNSFEKSYIESFEQPWADLKDLNTTFKTGIPIYEADNLHRNMTEIISQQWNVVRKFTNYLTQKGKALTKLGRELGLRGTLNKNFKSEIISEVQRNAIELWSDHYSLMLSITSLDILDDIRMKKVYKNIFERNPRRELLAGRAFIAIESHIQMLEEDIATIGLSLHEATYQEAMGNLQKFEKMLDGSTKIVIN